MNETSNSHTKAIVWFRNDLRLSDNEALTCALRSAQQTVALYIVEEHDCNIRPLGAASRWWLHHSLKELAASLAALGVVLLIRKGSPHDIVAAETVNFGATLVTWNRRYDGAGRLADTRIKSDLQAKGVEVNSYNGGLLVEPWNIATKTGTPYRVFTPFWRAMRLLLDGLLAPLPDPDGSQPRNDHVEAQSEHLDQLAPRNPDWAQHWGEIWRPGERQAQSSLAGFLDEMLPQYGVARDFPAVPGTSKLSPHLRFGEISPRQVVNAALIAGHLNSAVEAKAEDFVREIVWREFAYHLLFHYPDLPTVNFNAKFDSFEWNDADERLAVWQQGLTGYPLVDAGMRELWQTGYMHNRVRMVAGSFLTKHLRFHWRHGEEWFWDTLVDADPASNAMNWQWIAGTGPDAAPYLRVFNPSRQMEKFDPDRAYVHRWVPELQSGGDYREPIVDHASSRQAALDAYSLLKSQ